MSVPILGVHIYRGPMPKPTNLSKLQAEIAATELAAQQTIAELQAQRDRLAKEERSILAKKSKSEQTVMSYLLDQAALVVQSGKTHPSLMAGILSRCEPSKQRLHASILLYQTFSDRLHGVTLRDQIIYWQKQPYATWDDFYDAATDYLGGQGGLSLELVRSLAEGVIDGALPSQPVGDLRMTLESYILRHDLEHSQPAYDLETDLVTEDYIWLMSVMATENVRAFQNSAIALEDDYYIDLESRAQEVSANEGISYREALSRLQGAESV